MGRKKRLLAEMMGGVVATRTPMTEDGWSDLIGVAKMIQQHGRTLEKMAKKKAEPGARGSIEAIRDYANAGGDLLGI
jgi:hypothetical protein